MNSNSKKAIVIGGSKGIGKRISINLKKNNYKTLTCSRKEIDTSDIKSVINFTKKNKSADILVLNSGGPPPLDFNKINKNDWENTSITFSWFLFYLKILKLIKWLCFIFHPIIKEPGTGLVISSSLRSAMSSLLKSYSILQAKNNISVINIGGYLKLVELQSLLEILK